MGFFPVDDETLRAICDARPPCHPARPERYCKEQGLFRDAQSSGAALRGRAELDLTTIEPRVADRSACTTSPSRSCARPSGAARPDRATRLRPSPEAQTQQRATVSYPDAAAARFPTHGSVVIAAITSCTNTSNPAVLFSRPACWPRRRSRPG
ncbi:MAG: hypothetical protein IPG96_20410 [Proteobacteria bacterium]|nr:hypothetical protein [Pseudomonadota bacterium]